MNVEQLNFHHLRYFWAVARDGNLTRTAKRLRVAPSALSAQIQHLEEHLGQQLFLRQGRRLDLTEAGKIALLHAEEIFSEGSDLLSTFERGRQREQLLRIGAVGTLSRNFQESLVRPLLEEPGVTLRLESGTLEGLLSSLESHALDLVLTNRAPHREVLRGRLRCRRIARQGVSIVGSKRPRRFRFPGTLSGARMLLPGRENELRAEFDTMCDQMALRIRVLAEVDDMAMLRLLARDTDALALVPSVVVRDELRSGALYEHCVVPGLFETFYAITAQRSFPHPLLQSVLAREEHELLGDGASQSLEAP